MSLNKHPRCEHNHPMVVRSGQFGKFYGCVYYPNHKSTVNEPWCSNNHPMSKKKSKYGEFFSCRDYKNCDSDTFDFEIKDKRYIAILISKFENDFPDLALNSSDTIDSNVERMSTFEKDARNTWYKDEVKKEKLIVDRFKDTLSVIPNNLFEEFYRLLDNVYTRDKLKDITDSEQLVDHLKYTYKNRSTTTINSSPNCASCGAVVSFNGQCKCSG